MRSRALASPLPPALAAVAAVTLGALLVWMMPGEAVRPSPNTPSAQGAARLQASVHLTVTSGSGSGVYQPGDTVYVEPYRMPDMRVFDRWEGDLPSGVGWRITTRAHMTFTMPSRNVAITGTLRPAPLWALRSSTAAGGPVHYHPPAPFYHNTGGAVVLLHDAGEGADFWLRSTESRLFQRAAAARGHGVLVLESTDRTTGRWDTENARTDANPDLQRLLSAIHASGLAGAPLVLVGVGQGAELAELAANAFLPLSSVHVVGTVLVGSAGLEPGVGMPVPTMFVLSERDDPGLNHRATLRAWTMGAQGTHVEIVALGPWPVFPRRFWRIDGFTAADSEGVHQALEDAGIVDADGWVTRDPAGLNDPGLPGDLARSWPQVREQLVAGWAGHGFSTHATEAMLDFAESEWGLPVPVPTPEPTRRAYIAYIDVEGGSKGRSESTGKTESYGDQDLVPIWADPDPAGKVFDRWTGTTRYLDDPLARHTTAFVGDIGCCRLTATYRAADEWQPAAREIDGRQVYVHVPPEPVGLVFFFHGAGGSSAGWTDEQRVENWLLVRDAVAGGYAIAVTESEDRVARQWSPLPPSENPDIQHVARLQAQLVSSGQLPAGLPTFGIGMSNGGGFVTRAADALGWQGAAVYAAACRRSIAETTTVPVAWLLAENDRRVSNQDAQACHQRLAERGVDTELHVNAPSPVYPERFWRLPGVTAPESRIAYDALRTAGLLDRLDYQRLPPSESAWRAALLSVGTVPLGHAGAQLDVAHTEHRMFSDLNGQTLRFFDRQRGVTPVPTGTPDPATPTPTPTSPAWRGNAYVPVGWTGR